MALQYLGCLFFLCIFYWVILSAATATQQMKNGLDEDLLEYKLTKLLDIHIGKDSNNIQSALRNSIRSEVQNVLEGLKTEMTDVKPAYLDGSLRGTDGLEINRNNNFRQLLRELYTEISQIKKNISDVLSTSFSCSSYMDDVKNFINKSPVGVSFDNKICSSCVSKQLHHNLWTNSSYVPKNCKEVQLQGHNISGIYKIRPNNTEKPFMVLCDMETRGGGWTHIQKRYDGSQDFYLNWREYKFGFGDLEREFWLGLENIYSLTSSQTNELLVELGDRDIKYAQYKAFEVGPESDGYSLKVLSGFSGDTRDSLTYHIGQKFTTKDFDQDQRSDNCAVVYSGAWWYKDCHNSNLNGIYRNADLPKKYENQAIHWYGLKFGLNTLAKTRMLVRPSES